VAEVSTMGMPYSAVRALKNRKPIIHGFQVAQKRWVTPWHTQGLSAPARAHLSERNGSCSQQGRAWIGTDRPAENADFRDSACINFAYSLWLSLPAGPEAPPNAVLTCVLGGAVVAKGKNRDAQISQVENFVSFLLTSR